MPHHLEDQECHAKGAQLAFSGLEGPQHASPGSSSRGDLEAGPWTCGVGTCVGIGCDGLIKGSLQVRLIRALLLVQGPCPHAVVWPSRPRLRPQCLPSWISTPADLILSPPEASPPQATCLHAAWLISDLLNLHSDPQEAASQAVRLHAA